LHSELARTIRPAVATSDVGRRPDGLLTKSGKEKRRMPRRSPIATVVVETEVSEACHAVSAANEAVRHAQRRVGAGYKAIRVLENERGVAGKFEAITRQLQAARYATNVAAKKLETVLRVVRLRGKRRSRR
jgi:hypothetical protein